MPKSKFRFDGKKDYITIPSSTDWDLDFSKNFTIDIWIKYHKKIKIKWWFLNNIYYPIRKLFGIKEDNMTFHMKATKEMENDSEEKNS